MFAIWLIALVAGAFYADCKFDNCLVLQSAEGLRESLCFKAQAGNDDWVVDKWQQNEQKPDRYINQCWFYELAELDHMTNKKQMGSLKAIFSSAIDTYSKPYVQVLINI